MVTWVYRLDLVDIWKNHKELGPQKVAGEMANRLESLIIDDVYYSSMKEALVDGLREFAKDDSVTFDDFDIILSLVYDWADQLHGAGRLCWIKTF